MNAPSCGLLLVLFAGATAALSADDNSFAPSPESAVRHESIASERLVAVVPNVAPDTKVVSGVVTLVDTNRNLVVLQDAAAAHALLMDLTRMDFRLGERIELEGAASTITTAFPAYPDAPDGRITCASFEAPTNFGQYYLARLQGFLRVPVTGEYRFWVASDDSSELWLSDDPNPEHARKIASVEPGRWTESREWTRFPSQQSKAIFLKAGVPCFVRALLQQSFGRSSLAVAWQGPSMPRAVIEGKYLSPDTANTAGEPGVDGSHSPGIFMDYWTNFFLADLSCLQVTDDKIWRLRSVRVLSRHPGSWPEPLEVKPGERLAATNNFRWMRFQGAVRFVSRTDDGLRLELSAGQAIVQVVVRGTISEIPFLPDGSVIQVSGVGELTSGSSARRRLATIRVSRPDDITWPNTDDNWDRFEPLPAHRLTPSNPRLFPGQLIRLRGVVCEGTTNGLWRLRANDTFRGFASTNGASWTPVGAPVEFAMSNVVLAGFCVSSHQSNNVTATFDPVEGLAGPFNSSDVGAPPVPGDTVCKGGSLVVAGSGADIWSGSDQFHFAWQKLAGDAAFSAHLAGFSAADEGAKTGLMIRQSLDRRSPWAATILTPGLRVGLQARRKSGQNASGALNAAAFNWIKLTRTRNFFWIRPRSEPAVHPGETLDVLGILSWEQNLPVLTETRLREVRPPPRMHLETSAGSQNVSGGFQTVKIKALPQEIKQAQLAGYLGRFRIRGVVTFDDLVNGRPLLVVQDGSAACRVQFRSSQVGLRFPAGTLIEADGALGDDGTTTDFIASGLAKLGEANLPLPERIANEPGSDAQRCWRWGEIEGVARAVNAHGELLVATSAGTLPVYGAGNSASRFSALLDSTLRIQGVYWTNPAPRLLLPSLEFVDVLQPAPADPFAKPVFPTAAIRDLVRKAGSSHRMQIRGMVTCKREGFYVVQDRTGGLLVRPVSNASVKTGELVDVVGFPVASASGVMLAEALSRRAGQAVMPQPVVLPANTTFSGAWNQKLVQIEAVLLEQHVANDVQYLDLQAGQRVFRATLPLAGGRLDTVAPGSLVRVAGIARIEAADLSAGLLDATGKPFVASLELLLRNANDLSVIKRPPWWNWKYTAGTIALFCVALAMSFLWIKTLRRRVEERTHALRETMGKLQKETRISATLAERDRLAGEIHDSVEQGLSAIMLQLDAAKQFVNQPEEVDRFLTLAKNMAGFSRTEVHHVVWGMQSPLLENADLPAALRRVAREISVGDTPLVTVEVSGLVRPLPSSIEHHLLRIGQEAITNAVKHARPKIIRLRLDYEPDGIALAIEDDGCGFDPDAVPPGNGHFGLQGIRNRGRKMNARLEIGSQPGRGARIVVTIPLRPAATTIDS